MVYIPVNDWQNAAIKFFAIKITIPTFAANN